MNYRFYANHAALLSVVLTSVACPEGKSPPELTDQAPIAVEDALVYVAKGGADDERDALIVDVRGDGSRTELVDLPVGEVQLFSRPSRSGEAVALTDGRDAEIVDDETRDAENAQLVVLNRDGEVERYELGGRFGKLALSDDGRFALAYAPPGSFSAANAISVTDLTQKPKSASRTLLLDAAGGATPQQVVFSRASDGGRRFAAILKADAIMLIDLEHLEREEVAVPLRLPSQDQAAAPAELLFEGDRVFVRVYGSDQVTVLQFTDDDSARGFTTSLFQINTAASVQDIELVGRGASARLLALAGAQLLSIDPVTGSTASVSTINAFDRLEVFEGTAPNDDTVATRAFLSATGGARVGFLDLGAAAALPDAEIEVVELYESVSAMHVLAARKFAVATHDSGRLSLIDLADRTVSPIATSGETIVSVLDDAPRNRVWVVTSDGAVGTIDVSRFEIRQVLLDRPADDLLLLPGQRPRVAVLHDGEGDEGGFTLLDAARPSRDSARELSWSSLF